MFSVVDQITRNANYTAICNSSSDTHSLHIFFITAATFSHQSELSAEGLKTTINLQE